MRGIPRPKMHGLASCVVAVGVLAGSAWAGSADQDRLLAELDSDDHRVREAASATLLDPDAVSRQEILDLHARASTEEQRVRLLAAHRKRFAASPKPALGISFSPRENQITAVYEGFPAADRELLRRGDIILEIGGVDITAGSPSARATLRAAILSYDPYDDVQMVVLRETDELDENELPVYREQTIDVQLGEIELLAGGQNVRASEPTDAELQAAWELRLARQGLDLGAAPIAQATWHGPVGTAATTIRTRERQRPLVEPGAVFVAEESPRGHRSPAAVRKARQLAEAGRANAMAAGLGVAKPAGQRVPTIAEVDAFDASACTALVRELGRLQQEAAEQIAAAAATTDATHRQLAEERARATHAEIERTRRELRRLLGDQPAAAAGGAVVQPSMPDAAFIRPSIAPPRRPARGDDGLFDVQRR